MGVLDEDEHSGFSLFGKSKFADPYLLTSNAYIPKDWFSALDFALYLAIKFPLYRQAVRRTVAHFITDIHFSGSSGSESERTDMHDYLLDDVDLFGVLYQALNEQFIYGNAFAHMYYPFNRYLVDRRDGRYKLYAITAFDSDFVSYNATKMTYSVPDPTQTNVPINKRTKVDFGFTDQDCHDPSRIKVRLLDPKRMLINMNFVSGNKEYVWRFEEFFKSDVIAGRKLYQINETPIDMLRAMAKNQDFVFNEGSIFHFHNPFISGISNNGWGIPDILLNYNNIHQLQVYRCINESVGKDYLLPFRILSPAASAQGGGMDAAANTHLGRWQAAISQLIAKQRKDQTSIFSVPFPVTYQELGGNGKALAPVELIKQQEDSMLDGFGFMAEHWHGTLQWQQVPTAIRSFESTLMHIPRAGNRFVKWVVRNITGFLKRPNMDVNLMLPSVADNIENKQIRLQLAAGGEISRRTAYAPFNIENPVDEQIQRIKEDIEIEKKKMLEQQNFEREQQLGSANQVVDAMLQAQQGPAPDGGGAPAGGPPPPGAAMPAGDGQGGMTPLDLDAQGEQLAQQMLQIQDVGERRKAMNQIKASNPTLYAVMQRKMEDMRQQGASQGRKSVGQQ